MVCTRKKKQSNRKLRNQLNDFDQTTIFGNTLDIKQENATISEGTGDHEHTVDNPGSNLTANENFVNVRTLERCFNGGIHRENRSIVDLVENGV